MNVKKKLAEWRKADLIDDATLERLLKFEKERTRPTVLLSIAALGASTVALGIISIVAANWDGIPYVAKLVVDLGLLCALGGGVVWAESQEQPLLREVLIVVYYGGALASIALLGQIYQTGTPAWVAIVMWSLMTAPLMLLAHSHWVAWLWTLGLLSTFAIGSEEVLDDLLDHEWERDSAMILSAIPPLGLVAASKLAWLSRQRPGVAQTFNHAGWALLCFGLLMGPMLFYGNISSSEKLLVGPLVNGLLLAGLAMLLPKWLHTGKHAVFATQVTLLVGWLFFATATLFPRDDWQLVGALTQLVIMSLLAWVAALRHWMRAFNLLTALIALRVLVVYFEVFGSLLDTGMGLISGGMLTLLLAWAWRRKSPSLARQLAQDLQPPRESNIGH